jgi:hypothetical protein
MFEELAHRARDGREHHVVQRSAEPLANGLHVGEAHPQPVEPAVRSDRPVERRVGAAAEVRRHRVAHRADHGPQIRARILRVRDEAPEAPDRVERNARAPDGLGADELPARRRRARDPARRRLDGRRRIRREQDFEEVDARHAVDHAVVDLRDDGEAIRARETFDDPHLPQRLRAIELLRHDATGEPLELPLVSGPRQARVTDVVVDVEVLVVDPRGMPVDRQALEDLAVAWDAMEPRVDVGTDALDVDAALGRAERSGLVERRPCDVHVVRRLSAIRNELSRNPSRSYAVGAMAPRVHPGASSCKDTSRAVAGRFDHSALEGSGAAG